MKKITFCFLSFLFAQPLQASTVHGYIWGNVGSSVLNGFTQIPQGGTSGTTSHRRPTLDELNIHYNNFYTLGSRLEYHSYDLAFTYSRYAPRGRTTLKNILNTHGKQIRAGSSLSTLLKYDFLTLLLAKRFNYHAWEFAPFLQANLFKFHYEYYAYPIHGARTFNVTGFNVGLKTSYYFANDICASLNIAPPLPIANFTNGQVEVGINKKVQLGKQFAIFPSIGGGFQQLDYEDNQGVPNHICLRNGPYALVGMQVQFI